VLIKSHIENGVIFIYNPHILLHTLNQLYIT
jgi:hypothetical protein